MSSPPSRRIHTKTSELTNFFRGTSARLEVPSASDTDINSKKRVKIQLFGRSSHQSTASTGSTLQEPSIRTARNSDRGPPTVTRKPPPLPTTKPHSISIGSKLAATFGHSRLPKPSNCSTQTARPSTLSPSTSRAASYESGSSNGSRPRSTTPWPPKPLVTVSLSPDDVSEYKNLFTRFQPDSDLPPSPSTPTPNSRFQKADSPINPRRGQTPASAFAVAHRQATISNGDDRSPSRPVTHDCAEKAPPSLQRRPATARRPPSIPLPQTPVPNTPPLEIPLSDLFHAELEATGAQKSVASSHPAAQLLSRTTATLALDLPEANFDIESASAPQLRVALKIQNRLYDDLVKVTEANAAKMMSMEKKILSLDQQVEKKEKEISRKDKELKGLRWIINNGDSSQPQPLPAGVINHALLSPTSTPSESDHKVVAGSSLPSRLYYQSDHAESISIRSAASGSKSVSLRKPSAPAEVTYNLFYRNASTRRPSKMRPGLGAEKAIPEMPHTNNQLSVSPSPTSTLLPPSPSVRMSSLSAIPEAEGP